MGQSASTGSAKASKTPEDPDEDPERSASTVPPAQTLPLTEDVIAEAFSLETFPQFLHLLSYARALILLHGPYGTTLTKSKIFARAEESTLTKDSLSVEDLASSFAAAQHCVYTIQPAGPAKTDLQVFRLLWDATINVIEEILEDGNLDLEIRGWGIKGITAGYMGPMTLVGMDRDKYIELRARLCAALLSLTTLKMPTNASKSAVSEEKHLKLLSKARREVHTCSNLIVQHLMHEDWQGVRWYQGIAIAERWIANKGLEWRDAGDEQAPREPSTGD